MSTPIIDLDKIEHLKALLATVSGLGDNAVTVIIVSAIIYFMIESLGYVIGAAFAYILYKLGTHAINLIPLYNQFKNWRFKLSTGTHGTLTDTEIADTISAIDRLIEDSKK